MRHRVRSNSGKALAHDLGFIDPSTAANIASGVASLFSLGRSAQSVSGGLGFVDPATAIALVNVAVQAAGGQGSGTSLMSGFATLLGGGKSAARRAMEGKVTAAFPPGTSFEKYLNMTMPFRGKTRTHREVYEIKKNDNWMLSRGIGSANDYGAYVALWMLENGHIDPLVKDPSSPLYQNAPVFASNKINIFDLPRLQAYYKKDEIKAKIAEVTAQENALKTEITKIESAIPAASEKIRQYNAALDNVTKDINRFCSASYPGGPVPNYERDPAKCQIERTRYETFVANNPPPPDANALARQLTALQTQLQNISGVKTALQNELSLGAQLPLFSANIPGAYEFDPAFYAVDAPSVTPPAATPAPASGSPAWLLPALGGAALLLLMGGKRQK